MSIETFVSVPKTSCLVGQPGELGKGSKEARPSPFWQARPHALLGALPRWACLPQLGRARLSEPDEFLAPVLPGADGDPAGVDQRAEVTRQRRLVQRRHPAEVPLPDLTHTAEAAEQRVPGRAQADAAQLLVVEPAHGPGRLSQSIAQARRGERIVALAFHVYMYMHVIARRQGPREQVPRDARDLPLDPMPVTS